MASASIHSPSRAETAEARDQQQDHEAVELLPKDAQEACGPGLQQFIVTVALQALSCLLRRDAEFVHLQVFQDLMQLKGMPGCLIHRAKIA